MAQPPGQPRVVIRSQSPQVPPAVAAARILYPWKTYVTNTVFWIGEKPSENNPVPNDKSSWDMNWVDNFGGYDDPRPEFRIADHARGEFRPKAFIPKLNPFYVALPYNDISSRGGYKTEAPRVIPWFARVKREDPDIKSVCKGRWIQIYRSGRSCYAQWEDCGPWLTDDWPYVFGDKSPSNRNNKGAGIDISPAVRDYLQIASGDRVHWRFVEASQVPHGPWKKYGQVKPVKVGAPDNSLEAQRRYLEYLRKLRDEQFMKRPVGTPP